MAENLINWLEAHSRSCQFKSFLGVDCPGCGIQRSIIALMKGQLLESIQLYPALLPVVFMFSYLAAHLLFKFRNGALVLRIIFIANIAIISFHYIYLLITNKP